MTPALHRPRRRRLQPHRGVVVLSVFALAGLAALVLFMAWSFVKATPKSAESGKPVRIDVPQGARAAEIASLLESKGVIESAEIFRIRARLDEMDSKFKAGTYDLRTGMRYEDVVASLTAGPPIEYVTVTIPEGFTVEQIGQRLEKKARIPAEEFTKLAKSGAPRFADRYPFLSTVKTGSLEGYLFPKTYQLKEGATASDAVEAMLSQFAEEIATVDLGYAKSKNLDLNDVVIVASLVEREAAVAKDRKLISSVIYNRLREDMRLEIDATVQYALGKQRARLLYGDLEVDSPYNTYRIRGLPPGPIASPGLASLKAAAAPAKTEYLYYVLTGKDGSHTFATNGADFLKAKAEAKKGLK